MSKQITLVDMDDVLNKFIPTLLETYNNETGANLIEEDITNWDISRFMDEAIWKDDIVKRKGFYRYIPMAEGAEKFVRELMNFSEVFIVSYCYPWVIEDKVAWIEQNLPFFDVMRNFIPCYYKQMVGTENSVLIDDNPWNLMPCTTKQGNLIVPRYKKVLLSKPHNREFCMRHRDIHRTDSLEEALERVKKIF
jgi:5'(3')-deoxyribonucleotidase